jgi:hypothetical protein
VRKYFVKFGMKGAKNVAFLQKNGCNGGFIDRVNSLYLEMNKFSRAIQREADRDNVSRFVAGNMQAGKPSASGVGLGMR